MEQSWHVTEVDVVLGGCPRPEVLVPKALSLVRVRSSVCSVSAARRHGDLDGVPSDSLEKYLPLASVVVISPTFAILVGSWTVTPGIRLGARPGRRAQSVAVGSADREVVIHVAEVDVTSWTGRH